MRTYLVAAVAALVAPLGIATAAQAGSATTHYLTVHTKSGKVCDKSVVNGMLNNGTVIGTEFCGESTVFIRTKSGRVSLYRLPAKDGNQTSAANIASNGDFAVADRHGNNGALTSYVVTSTGQIVTLRDPKAHGHGTIVNGLNDHGVAVGYYCKNKKCSKIQGFIYNRTFHDYSPKNNQILEAQITEVTNSGSFAGDFYDRAGVLHGFIASSKGKVKLIQAPMAGASADEGTIVTDLASNGSICGISIDSNKRERGFVERHGRFTIVDPAPGSLKPSSEVGAINSHGEIGGSAAVVGNSPRAFLGHL